METTTGADIDVVVIVLVGMVVLDGACVIVGWGVVHDRGGSSIGVSEYDSPEAWIISGDTVSG
jgi:hypothetical protein